MANKDQKNQKKEIDDFGDTAKETINSAILDLESAIEGIKLETLSVHSLLSTIGFLHDSIQEVVDDLRCERANWK